jgi:sugar transferase (PEP-CTERM/EpsH1 system associated)
MRALYLSTRFCWPTISGAHLRDFYLARQVAAKYTLTYLGLDREMDGPVGSSRRERLEVLPDSEMVRVRRPAGYGRIDLVRGIIGPTPVSILNFTAPQVMDKIERVLAEDRFDIIQFEGVHLLAYARRIRQIAPNVPLICDWHNVESEVQRRYAQSGESPARRLYARRTAQLLKRAEREVLQLANAHTVCSERERQMLLQEVPQANITEIPNGVDTAFFAAGAAGEGLRQNVVFVGSMNYHANIDAALFFAKAIWPGLRERRPDLRFVIVGSRPVPEIVELANQPGITVTGTVDDLRPHYGSAVMVVAPVRVASGTRLKVLEAMAAGVPVISTPLGAEGLAITPGKDILIAETPAETIATAAALHRDTTTWQQLAANAFRLVQAQYDWSVVGERLLSVYTELLAKRPDADVVGVGATKSRG